ncbi:acetyl-CoA carboxylase, carboxyltransferase subunit beta [Engelhardtia mirabilis]|uniref:Acetyl-coenzyme A carboxylase carboxyl transferase subunit beta n=1 Tax=Engelhardtia mirabilis TaxID=2528011 RepID=A0A518BJS0_9BACT|nr:Acetyl-coenzyme A carboxylase carboxyl transferase subunit beta [Planctomycetes bacterium Pla133]QDV01557.1 Acetyl-coenzyme A carboxylase carboxyl transferase subunit beta [Planctomycetes bacterium Pla86]
MSKEPDPKEVAEQTEDPSERKPGRLSRLRFSKKKDMPGGLWLKCENCSSLIYRKELEAAGRVCPSCSFHFTLPGRQRVQSLLDPGSWEEVFADITGLDRLSFTDKIPYSEKLAKTAERLGQNEALICGRGSIEGRSVILAVLDFSFMGGSMGEVVGEKLALASDLARVEGRPLVIFTSSGGARMHEGALSLMQMAKTCSALQSLSDAGGMSICVMTHPTTGGVTASFASVCDLVLAEPGALIGFAGPRVIAATLKQELPPGFQRAEFLIKKGMLDGLVSRSELRPMLGRLLDYAKGSHVGGDVEDDLAADEVPNRLSGGRTDSRTPSERGKVRLDVPSAESSN